MRDPAKRSWLLLLLALIATLTLLVAACGGDDDGGDDDGGDDGVSEPTATETTDAGGDDGGDDGGNGGGDDALAELEDIAGSSEDVDGVITYTFKTTGAPEGEWTIYSQGDKSRIDIASSDGNFVSITTPEASYTCTESGGQGFCFEGEGDVGSNPFAGLFTQYGSSEAVFGYIDLFSDVDVESSSENIASMDANCFTASGDFGGDSGTIKWCFSDSGLLLLSSYDLGSGNFEMKATEASEDVPSDAFEPPYEVTEIPGQ